MILENASCADMGCDMIDDARDEGAEGRKGKDMDDGEDNIWV
jgi:hypothetical protein